MITVTNYTSATAGIDFDKMPAAIKEGHKFFTEFGDLYNDDAEIKGTIDLYLRRLNEAVEKKEPAKKIEVKPNPAPNEPGNYYVSAIKYGTTDTSLLLGPFKFHPDAEKWVDKVSDVAKDKFNKDGHATWASYGTVKMKDSYTKPGILNKYIPEAFEKPNLVPVGSFTSQNLNKKVVWVYEQTPSNKIIEKEGIIKTMTFDITGKDASYYTVAFNDGKELNFADKTDPKASKISALDISELYFKQTDKAPKEPETALGIYENASCQVIGEDGKPDISPAAIEQLESCTEKLPQTKSFFYHNGKYDAGREELHRQIIDTFKENKPCIVQRQPIAVLTGGPPGSGKSTWLKKYAKWINSENIYHIDADEVRAKLPEYLGWNASATHQETKDIVNTLIDEIGNPCEYDLVYDGTMNKADNYQPLIDKLKKLGYRVFIIYISVPKGISQKRVLERYKKRGRYVPKTVINEVYERGLDAFEKLIKEADGYIRVDGTTGKIAEKGGMPMPGKERYPKAADKPTECGCQHNKKAKKAAKHATAEDYIADLTSGPDKLKNLTEKQVIAIGLQFEKKYRNPKSSRRDEKRDSVKRLSPTPENLIRWMQHPGKFDLIGVDTFERTSATSDYKREISKQKFWNNLFRIKINV